MTSNEIQKNIKNQKGRIIELFRNEVDEFSLLLFPIYQGSDFLCGANASDFKIDGYKFIRNKYISDIVGADKNETLDFYTNIYKRENLIPKEKCPYSADSISKLVCELQKSGEAITLECNFDDAIDYYFGKIISVEGNIAYMQCFDGGGVLFKDKVKVNLDFVSMITIGDRYTSIMSKYIKW